MFEHVVAEWVVGVSDYIDSVIKDASEFKLSSDLIGLPEVIFAISGIVLTVVIACYFANKSSILRDELQKSNRDKDTLQAIINNNFIAAAWRFENEEKINCTKTFASILSLNPEYPISYLDILNQFSPTETTLLTKIINDLGEKETPFSKFFHLRSKNLYVEVTGKCLVLESAKIYIVFLEDVTKKTEEEKKFNTSLEQLSRESDELKLILDSIPVAVWVRDGKGAIKFCNAAYAGSVESDIDGVIKNKVELIEPRKSSSPYSLYLRSLESGERELSRSHLVIGGSRRLLEINESPSGYDNGSIGYALDLTLFEDAEQELKKNTASHQELLQQISNPIAVFGKDTRLEFFNSAYQKLFDYDETFLYSKPAYGELLEDLRTRRKLPEHPNFPEYKKERLARFNTLMSPVQELLHLPQGQIVRMTATPHPLRGLILIFDDVTDKLALERRYNTLIAVQKETLDHLYEGIAVFGSDLRLRLTNPAMLKLWSLEVLDAPPGSHFSDIFEKIQHYFQDRYNDESIQDALMRVFNQRVPKKGRIARSDKAVTQYTYVPLPDGSHMVSFVDVSDHWLFEQALKERNQALERADRLKSDFISHVSYELRAPLNTIGGFVDILINQYFGELNERQLDYCKGINDSSQRLLTLINDMIDLASIEAGQLNLNKTDINLEQFLQNLIGLVANRAHDQGVELAIENRSLVQTFYADEKRLKQAFFRLITNAIKFTSAGGKITITADVDFEQRLCIAVKDTGIGISEHDRSRIFNLFEYGEVQVPKNRGAGLGLPLVKSLIELHDGVIKIESEKNIGTNVMCSIPYADLSEQMRQNSTFETLTLN